MNPLFRGCARAPPLTLRSFARSKAAVLATRSGSGVGPILVCRTTAAPRDGPGRGLCPPRGQEMAQPAPLRPPVVAPFHLGERSWRSYGKIRVENRATWPVRTFSSLAARGSAVFFSVPSPPTFPGGASQSSPMFGRQAAHKFLAANPLPPFRRDKSTSLSPPATYSVATISSDGSLSMASLRVHEILRKSSGMHARDLFSLALTSRHDLGRKRYGGRAVRRPPSVILPRGKEVVVSFGNVRALIGKDWGLIFDAHKPSIQLLSADLANTFESKMNEANEFSDGENLYVDDEYNVHMEYLGEPFELVFIEEILRDTCDTFNRRLRVYEPIVDTFMSRTANEVFSASGVQKLVPIKDSLQEFELNVKQCLECITHLLDNDEDMLGLLLTEREQAQQKGEALQHRLHESVELLFEEYARQLSNILHEIHYLLRRVQSKQELVALSLDAYRNRMIRMNVYLGIAGLGLASGTTVAGFYGMNLINGLEDSPVAFNNVVMSTSAVGILLFMGCTSYLSGANMRKRTAKRLGEIETISGALSDMASLDYTVKVMLEEGKPMDKEGFKRHLLDGHHSGDIHQKEIDLLFDILDVSNNGFIDSEDFRSIESLGHQPLKHVKISPLSRKKSVVSDLGPSRQQFVEHQKSRD